jgi:phenylglyoxylate dehydrogenase epsilon subunit
VVAVDGSGESPSSGEKIEYEKMLLATGAAPKRPPVKGLEAVPHHVLRTLEDALNLRSGIRKDGMAVVLGAGLIGLHAAENLAKGGMRVVVVEALSQALPGYLTTSEMIWGLFECGVKSAERRVQVKRGPRATWPRGRESCPGHSVATGFSRVKYLAGSGIGGQGILVDERMRTNVSRSGR